VAHQARRGKQHHGAEKAPGIKHKACRKIIDDGAPRRAS